MPKFNIEYTVSAECDKHGHKHIETLTLRSEHNDIEEALTSFFRNWNTDDYDYFKNLKFCPECETLSNTSCDINSIEIIPARTKETEAKGSMQPIPTVIKNTQNKELCETIGTEFHETYSAHAIYCVLNSKIVGDLFNFRKENIDNFVPAALKLFNNNKLDVKRALDEAYRAAKGKIKLTPYPDGILSQSVPTYLKNIQNKSLCDVLRVPYHKIHAAKAVVMILKEHGIEPRKFRADNKLDFAGAVLALFNDDAVMAKKSLEKNIKMARSM